MSDNKSTETADAPTVNNVADGVTQDSTATPANVVVLNASSESMAAQPDEELPANVSLLVTNEHVNKIVEAVRQTLRGRRMTMELLVPTIARLMIVSSQMQLPNSNKKAVLLTGLERYLNTTKISKDEIPLYLLVASSSIDSLYDVRTGKIKFATHGCFGLCAGAKTQ